MDAWLCILPVSVAKPPWHPQEKALSRSEASSHGKGCVFQIKGTVACHHACARVPLLPLRASNLECPTGPRRGYTQRKLYRNWTSHFSSTNSSAARFAFSKLCLARNTWSNSLQPGLLARPRFPSRALSEPPSSIYIAFKADAPSCG